MCYYSHKWGATFEFLATGGSEEAIFYPCNMKSGRLNVNLSLSLLTLHVYHSQWTRECANWCHHFAIDGYTIVILLDRPKPQRPSFIVEAHSLCKLCSEYVLPSLQKPQGLIVSVSIVTVEENVLADHCLDISGDNPPAWAIGMNGITACVGLVASGWD